MVSFEVGIAVVLCLAIFAAARYRREHKDEPVVRWLDTHSIREWMRLSTDIALTFGSAGALKGDFFTA
jgi:hypothetical protein